MTTITRPKLSSSLAESEVHWTRVSDLLNAYSPDFEGTLNDSPQWMSVKAAAPKFEELRESVLSEGVKDAIFYDGTMIGNGHHRLAVLIEAGYEEVPTTDDFEAQWEEHGCTSF